MEIDMTCHECYLSAFSSFTRNTLCTVTNLCVDQGISCNCKIKITKEDIEAARKEVEAERATDKALIKDFQMMKDRRKAEYEAWVKEVDNLVDEFCKDYYKKLNKKEEYPACLSCSFSSDARIINGGTFYCSKRIARVPPDFEGCELHSERKENAESNSDEAKSLDNIIDECFNEMRRLIEAGMNVGVDLVSKKSKTAYISHVPIDRDEFETAKAIIGKLTEENKANRELVANMEEAIINCLGPYGKNNIADMKVRNKKLCEENEELSNENKILQQEVALLKSKRKKDSGDIASLEIKISKMKKELSGKWRLLEVGEKPQKGDQAFLIDSNNVRIWVEPNGFKGIVKEKTVPVRRKITI